ncbi:MAG: GYD domain-containing protein [Actinomycetota bacterium]
MSTFVMLSTLGPDGFATLHENPHRLEAVNEEVEDLGVKILHQYVLLGEYDFLTVVEAPDNATMATLATRLAARGTLKTRTIATIDVPDFIAALEG